ncbi:hypothetical protein KKC1_03960 [Calderihabitans maritimus]|uniref:Uncharacterized protein n=1 Tax=Calderihabitans maritimus TaxID=1246530 RepID=A0A1Z5HNZ2_9FIRM|nr:hypothetical protein KKC1_03960 [Calderihabitans maritimus]
MATLKPIAGGEDAGFLAGDLLHPPNSNTSIKTKIDANLPRQNTRYHLP